MKINDLNACIDCANPLVETQQVIYSNVLDLYEVNIISHCETCERKPITQKDKHKFKLVRITNDDEILEWYKTHMEDDE